MTTQASGETRYSEKIDGDKSNFNWPVRFDDMDGYVGITQFNDADIDRILLSPVQIKALIDFVRRGDDNE